MGTDISGWVEVKSRGSGRWLAAVDAGTLLDRDYDAFCCVFGATSYANFVPIAKGRDIPVDASQRVRADFGDGKWTHGASWVTWGQLAMVDWDEEAPYPDGRLHRYVRTDDGALDLEGKAASDRAMIEHPEISRIMEDFGSGPDQPWIWSEGAEWTIGEYVFRAERMRRREAMGDDWWMLFDVMRTLARRHGDDGVRLVAWFSS
jgi:hypothetical protein